MKTTKEWIDMLPQDIQDRVYKYKAKNKLNLNATLYYGLANSFVWYETSEGNEFWYLVAKGNFDEARQLLKTNTEKR